MIPTLETKRLILRAPTMADFEPLCAYFRDPRSAFNGGPKDETGTWASLTSIMGQWSLRGHGIWFAHARESEAFIGFAGIFHPHDWPEPELGYGIIAKAEGKGLAFEAASAARAGAAQLGLNSLPSYISPQNTRSATLAKRLGATYEKDIVLRGETAQIWRHPKVTS